MKILIRDHNFSRLHRTYASTPAVTVVSFGSRGEGVGLLNGVTPVSIAGTIPGEVVRCTSITKKPRNGKLQANSFELIKKSPHRVDILCPHFSTCGACQFLHFSYSEQLLAKKQLVRSYAHEEYWDVINDCVPSPGSTSKKNGKVTFHYRNKVTLVAFKDDVGNDSSTKVGYFHKDDSKKFAAINSCIVASHEINVFLKGINELIGESGIDALNPAVEKKRQRHLRKTERGIIRNVTDKPRNGAKPFLAEGSLRQILVRSTSLGKLHLTIVTNGQQVEQRDTLIDLIQTRYGSLIGSIHHTTNMPDSRYYLNVSSKQENEANNRVMFEKVLGMRFWFSVLSFLQTNLKQSENIYKHVIEALEGMDCVIDAYCGIGILSCILAEKKSLVIGIDSVAENIDDATFNSEQNNVQSKTQFYLGRSEELLPAAFSECKKLLWNRNRGARMSGKIGLIVNPPRTGLTDFVLQNIAQQSPSTIAYISCNPETLFSDISFLQQLSQYSYTLEKVIPFDMFPHTNHVETLAILEQRNLE